MCWIAAARNCAFLVSIAPISGKSNAGTERPSGSSTPKRSPNAWRSKAAFPQLGCCEHCSGTPSPSWHPALEETASRLSGERSGSLPPLRIRAGWEHRLTDILKALKAAPGELVGRREVERIFGVSRATAIKILDRFGANLAANALVLRRSELVDRLQALTADPTVSFERERQADTLALVSRDSLGEFLGEAAQRLRNNATYARGEAAARQQASRFGDFPAEIDLTPSTLHIQFQGLQDFLMKVGSVVYALQNDLEAIAAFLDSKA